MRIYLARFSVWMGRVGSCNSRDEERERERGEEREDFIYISTCTYLVCKRMNVKLSEESNEVVGGVETAMCATRSCGVRLWSFASATWSAYQM